MLIYILENAGLSTLRHSIAQHVDAAGHALTDKIGLADLAIGFADDTWPPNFPGEKMVILHEPGKPLEIFGEMTMVNVFTLTMIESPSQTLSEWLRLAQDPKA